MIQSILTNNTYRVKQSNTELIRNTLKKLGIATRNEIAKETDLSIATCGNILKELIEAREVFEDELDNCRGGRPARKYLYNKNFSLAICITIQSDDSKNLLSYAVTNLFGEIQKRKVKSYPIININIIDDLVFNLIREYPNIKALGIGIPGISNEEGTILYNDIEELNRVDLVKIIKGKYQIEVSIASSPSLTAYGYYKNHPEFENKVIATVIAPKKHIFGAGFIINGKIYKGDTNLAGEIGYMDFNEKVDDKDAFASNIITALTGIISILGPSMIVLTGSMFTEDNFHEVCQKCKKIMPPEFIPQFELKLDASDEYLNGVINMALDSMAYNVQLIAHS